MFFMFLFIYLFIYFLIVTVFNYVCVSAFEQGHLDPWRSKSALIIIIIIIIIFTIATHPWALLSFAFLATCSAVCDFSLL